MNGEESNPIIKELKKKMGYWWSFQVLDTSPNDIGNYVDLEIDNGVIVCCNCGSNQIVEIHEEVFGTIAGGEYVFEFKCKRCGKITEATKEYG